MRVCFIRVYTSFLVARIYDRVSLDLVHTHDFCQHDLILERHLR